MKANNGKLLCILHGIQQSFRVAQCLDDATHTQDQRRHVTSNKVQTMQNKSNTVRRQPAMNTLEQQQ